MGLQTFERYELKYLLTREQKQAVLQAMKPYMKLDHYGRATIRNLYYDTDTFRLIRRSLERPAYKEKLRVRSYCQSGPDDEVFIELKKKYQSVVYKRRILIPHAQAMRCLKAGEPLPVTSLVAQEIDYFRKYYETLHPVVFLSYEREAFYSLDTSGFRVTFDENILYREKKLSLSEPPHGTSLLQESQTLMGVKTSGGLPLWLVHVLSGQRIFKTAFSKYGAAYQNMLHAQYKGERKYA